mgnify:CR=1 FL=1
MYSIPSPLNFIENKLIPSVLPYSFMQLSEQTAPATESKIAGKPYLPPREKLPLTEAGDEMFLVIQINFADAHLPVPFPQKGIFQLFIDPIMLNAQTIAFNIIPRKFYEVRFWPEPIHVQSEFLGIQNNLATLSIKKELSIRFQTRYEPVSFTDYRLQSFIQNTDIQSFEQQTEYPFEEVYAQHFLSAENKVGGYPYFINEDIRLADESLRIYDTMLFQIVSNEDDHIMIGDCGVIKLFINKQDLTRMDFSDVLLFVEDYT